MKNVLLTFTVQTFVEAETVHEFEDKRDELLDDLETKGFTVTTIPVECGNYQLE